jgi:site-specific DNA-methyltransferase (adenine-specific)
MLKFPLPRIDKDDKLYELLLRYCRLKPGEIWTDQHNSHKVGCLDISVRDKMIDFTENLKFKLAVHDPPYNMVAFNKLSVNDFIDWSAAWIKLSFEILDDDSSLYVWLGADQRKHFEPFAEFIMMMKKSGFKSRNFITLRNQRGYGTSKNWMSIRQELLYYIKGNPVFNSESVYTAIPKILRGYYKEINGKVTENIERSKSKFIRSGNVWVDIQQVFHLREENVNGCYAQKPLDAIERVIKVSSSEKDRVIDFFSHSGTTLLASEKFNRVCYTTDIDPVFCEITIRRLERFRETGKTGWQNSNPFEKEILDDKKLKEHLSDNYDINVPKKLK